MYNKVVIKGIEFNKYNIGVLDKTALNPVVFKRDISPKVLYKVESFKEGILDNNFGGTMLKLKRAFDTVF
jgi:hypothetical protein